MIDKIYLSIISTMFCFTKESYYWIKLNTHYIAAAYYVWTIGQTFSNYLLRYRRGAAQRHQVALGGLATDIFHCELS